jgi:hypothetical protein
VIATWDLSYCAWVVRLGRQDGPGGELERASGASTPQAGLGDVELRELGLGPDEVRSGTRKGYAPSFGHLGAVREMSHPSGMVSSMPTRPAPLVRTAPHLGRGWCVLPALPRAAGRWGRRVTAAEPRASYEPAPPGTSSPAPAAEAPGAEVPAAEVAGVEVPAAEVAAGALGTEPAGDGAGPFGLPVLAELPELASMLEALTVADGAMCQALGLLARLVEDDQVVAVSGVSVEEWIGIVARHTRMDRRLLGRTARLLHRFPTLRAAVTGQQLSWPQLRGLSLVLRDCPPVLDERVDAFLAELLPHLAGADPDAVIDQTRRAIGEWTAQLEPEVDEPPARNHLHLQPRLDGTGGRISGELDAVGLAIVDDATAPTRAQLDHPGGIGGARADNLLARLTHTCPPTEAAGGNTVDDREDPIPDTHGPDEAVVPGSVGGPSPGVKLLLRAELSDLLDATRTPVELLTRLVGGSLRLTSTAARRLLDTRGAELRTIIVDHGHVIGIGRASRQPPGWLRDATLAIHSTCIGPLCDRPALGAELDHARPWYPTHPAQPGGRTDVDNLGPLCARTNRAKEAAGWRAHQHRDGRRTWTHPRTGLQITSLPTTWHPPPRDGPGTHHTPRDGPG